MIKSFYFILFLFPTFSGCQSISLCLVLRAFSVFIFLLFILFSSFIYHFCCDYIRCLFSISKFPFALLIYLFFFVLNRRLRNHKYRCRTRFLASLASTMSQMMVNRPTQKVEIRNRIKQTVRKKGHH